jgi:hypothetical protein
MSVVTWNRKDCIGIRSVEKREKKRERAGLHSRVKKLLSLEQDLER